MIESSQTGDLSKEEVQEIDRLLREGKLSHKLIGKRFGVVARTISRIQNGYSFSEITGRKRKEVKRDIHRCLTTDLQNQLNLEFDIDASVNHIIVNLGSEEGREAAYKLLKDWGFNTGGSLGWATFTTWYGKESLVTDGVLAWCIPSLVKLCQALAAHRSDIAELPTFSAGKMMSYPIGTLVKVLATRNEGYVLERGVALSHRIAKTAARHHFEIRWAGNQRGIVYLTKAKSRKTLDTSSVALGCAATMELVMKNEIKELEIELEEEDLIKAPEIVDVHISGRTREGHDESKIAAILKCFDAAKNTAHQELCFTALLETMMKRGYKLQASPGQTLKNLRGLDLYLKEAFVECLSIVDNDDLDEAFTSACAISQAHGFYPFQKEPHYLLLEFNTKKS